MRSLLLSLFVLTGIFSTTSAQIKVSDKAVISVPYVGCEQCKEKIEFFISKQYGVSSVKVDLKKKTTTVTWLMARTTKENIKVAIANLGYQADDIEAEEFAAKRLPKLCKQHIEAAIKAKPPQAPAVQ